MRKALLILNFVGVNDIICLIRFSLLIYVNIVNPVKKF